MRIPHLVATAVLAAACAMPTSLAMAPALAAEATVNLAKLQKLAAGMGLEDVGDKKDVVKFIHHGSIDYEIYLQPVADGLATSIYIPLAKIAPDALARAPAVKMLEFNEGHSPGFAMYEQEGEHSLYMQHRLPAALATPQGLRADIDAVIAAADEGVDLWDQDKWNATGAAGDGKPAAFSISNAMFVTKHSDGFGMWQKRPTNVFSSDETLRTYAELHGFTFKPEGDSYRFGFKVDAELRTAKGETLFSKVGIMQQSVLSHARNKEFTLDLDFNAKGLEPGDYVLSYLVHDLNGDQTATIEQPFSSEAQAAAAK